MGLGKTVELLACIACNRFAGKQGEALKEEGEEGEGEGEEGGQVGRPWLHACLQRLPACWCLVATPRRGAWALQPVHGCPLRRYGVVIGGFMAPAVRVVMILLSPISWPLGRLLDWLLGAGKPNTLGRGQLSALVDIHRSETGLGGNLTHDEVGAGW